MRSRVPSSLVDIGTFLVNRVIIHEIPEARMSEKDTNPVRYSDAPSPLDHGQRAYFRKRITRSLQKAFDVERDPGVDCPVPDLMQDYFVNHTDDDDDNAFVAMSQAIAEHLHRSQGLVSVIEGTIGSGRRGGRCLAVLKLEMEPGVHVEQVEIGGKRTFQVTVEDVTLTETTRVFKASLFTRFSEVERLTGVVSDDQLESTTIGRDIAEFFLKRFLGCRMAMNPGEATKQFVEKSTGYFNDLPDEETIVRYQIALRSELESQTPTIDPTRFARTHLQPADRDGFLGMFRDEAGRVPTIPKDVERVSRLIGEAWAKLDNGVRLIGPPAEVEKVVTAVRVAVDEEGNLIVDTHLRSFL
jgi:hypothetical protein